KGLQGIDLDIGSVVAATSGEGIVKSGSGRMRLQKVNSFGLTTVNNGGVQGAGSVGNVVPASPTAGVSGRGTLGTVGDSTTPAQGMVAPGDNAAPVNTGPFNTQSVVLSNTSTFSVILNAKDVSTSVPGTGHDWLNVTGSIELGGATLTGGVGAIA